VFYQGSNAIVQKHNVRKKKMNASRYFILSRTGGNKEPLSDVAYNHITSLRTRDRAVYLLPSININYYQQYSLFESELIEWSRQFCAHDKLFIDIGAHTGTYAITLAESCKLVHCFEPQRMTYYALCGGVALSGLSNVICHHEGLGSLDQIGVQTLQVVSADGGGSSLHTNLDGMPTLAKEDIVVRTLDSYNFRDVGFIKMDVEGNEPYVILGSLKTLSESNYPSILFEANSLLTGRGTGALMKIDSILIPLGYQVLPVAGVSNMYLAVQRPVA
jgi:FkbM family methyltransferase